ncbi:BLOC-2 complex member HPS3-like [Haliotis cracherodii]|uniref:BLOC-2 complex member HPS3-like n=1 Tax=Haliotis cracherodii TaxID=6455 RepID=UPI0039EC10F4
MVRVFDCHSFKSKKVIPIQDEPLAICADEKHVFVATRRCTVVVFAITDDGCRETRRFETVSLVEQLLYNPAKNYLITVEFKKSWKNLTKYIRVYLNWDCDIPQGSKIKTKVRIAGKSHSSLISSTQNYLDVVEIPVDRKIADISVCSQTGNFAVAIDREVKVFHLVDKTVPSSGKTYRDVEIFLELCWNFRLVTLSLCEDYVVCSSQNEFQAVRLEYTDSDSESSRLNQIKSERKRSEDKDGQGHVYRTTPPSPGSSYRTSSHLSSLADVDEIFESDPPDIDQIEYSSIGQNRTTNPSPYVHSTSDLSSSYSSSTRISDDDYFQAWRFEGEDSETGEITIHLPGLQGTSRSLGHKSSPPVLQDLRGGPFKSSGGVRAITLLHFSDAGMREDWQQVTIVPAYLPGISRKVESGSTSTPVMSPRYRNMASMSCFVSGGRGGCLYSLYPRVKLVTCYRYTTSAVKIIPCSGLLHVATTTGVETHTARDSTVAIHQSEEYDFTTKASPPTDLDVCLIGIQPFIGTRDLTMTNDHLILLTKAEDPHSEDMMWSLYALQMCPAADLYRDMVSFGCKVMETGPSSYLHMLQEAHLHVKREMMFTGSPDALVEENFLESAALLGEFYSLPNEEDWRLCLPYYVMSNLSLDDIIRQAVQHKLHKKMGSHFTYGRGLLYYLNYILFLDDDPVDIKESCGDEVLHIYHETEPERLSHILLISRLQTFSPETAMDLLKKWMDHNRQREENASDFDLLAVVKLNLSLVDPETASSALLAIPERSLILICGVHPSLVHKDFTEFTPLAQLMRQHRPSTFLHLLVELFDRGVLTLDSSLKLLQNDEGKDMSTNTHIREYLEILVTDWKRKYIFEDAVSMLSEMYIKRTISKILPSSRQLLLPHQFQMPNGGHFTGRFSWLDYLPPFSGPKSISRPCQHITIPSGSGSMQRSTSVSIPVKVVNKADSLDDKCPCCFCNEDLLKLQSLLCSEELTEDLCRSVTHQIQNEADLAGGDSIWLLCVRLLDWKQATEFLIDRYPGVVPKFMACTYGLDQEKWQYGMRCLEAVMKELPSSTSGEEVYIQAYRGILKDLSEILPPEDFLSLLPADGSFTFMLPYITQCFRHQRAKTLKKNIIDKGRQMVTRH